MPDRARRTALKHAGELPGRQDGRLTLGDTRVLPRAYFKCFHAVGRLQFERCSRHLSEEGIEMTRNKHTKAKDRAQTRLANLAIGMSLLLAACGTSQALSGMSESRQSSVLRDPDNPYWGGASSSVPVVGRGNGSSVIRDPDNPFWTGSVSTEPVSDSAADPKARGPR
jgi:hypothetical protein